MRLDPEDLQSLQPLIKSIVAATVEAMQSKESSLGNRLAWTEAEAAELLGMQRHHLRDARLRGEVKGSRIGKKIYYSKSELLKLLERQIQPMAQSQPGNARIFSK